MSDSVFPPPDFNADANAPENRGLTTTEIDARHARQLVERAFSQLERGERGAAEISVRQAIHLSPGVPVTHSLAGLLALLHGDMETARVGYENAVRDFSKASPERERLIALRMAQADGTQVNASDFVPNLPYEIARLRAAIAETPLREFLADSPNTNHAAPRAPSKSRTENTPLTAPSPILSAPAGAPRPGFASRLQKRRRASAWAVGIAAASAAVVAFFVVRSIVSPRPAPPIGSTPTANSGAVENAPPANNAAGNSAAGTVSTPGLASSPAANATDTGSTPGSAPPTPTATVTVKPLPPTSAPSTSRSRPVPKPPIASKPATAPKSPSTPSAAPAIPGLPRPAPTRPDTPRQTPTTTPEPRPAPADPNFPPMPPPRVNLPSAGGEKTEFPRVIPEDD